MKFKLLLVAFFVLVLNSVASYGQAFTATYPFSSVNTTTGLTDPTAVPTATGATFGSFTAVVGATLNPNANTRFSFTGWDTGATNGSDTFSGSLNTGKYYQVTITPAAGYTLDINSITFTSQRSATGTRQYAVRSSIDTYGANLPASISPANADLSVVATNVFQVVDATTSAETGSTITLDSSYDTLSGATTFRFYGWNAEASGGSFGIDNVVINGVANVAAITTFQAGDWATGSTWVGGVVPTSAQNAIVNHAVTVTTAVTRDAGTTTTVNPAGSLSISNVYTNNGATNVTGNIQINNGGSVAGTNNLAYSGTTNTLILNESSGLYMVSNRFWPVTGGPYNVTVSGTGAQINTAVGPVAGTLILNEQLNLAAANLLTVNGTLQINTNGFINTNSPIYGSASTLRYNTGFVYIRSFEWTSDVATIGTTPGYPNNVQISSSTAFNYYNATTGPRGINGNLTIDSGSTLDFGATSTAGALTVTGNVINNGTLTLGALVGDDIKTAGNFTNAGTFNGNNRAIWFIKAGTQTVSSTTVPFVIPYVVTGNGTNVVLQNAVTISAPTSGTALAFGTAADVIDLNGNALIIGTVGVNSIITGTGGFKGSTTSDLTLNGGGATASIGTIKMVTDFNLRNFTLNRNASAVGCVMGSAVTVNNTLTLTNGHLDLGNFPMTIGGTATISGASATNYIIADLASGVNPNASLRKTLSAAGSFTYPIGDGAASANGSQYSPVTVTFTGGSYAGYAGFAVDDIKQPNMDASTHYITRYWSMTSSGITPTSYNVVGTYLAADVVGTETSSFANQWNGSAWQNNWAAIGSNTLTLNAVTTLPATNHFTAGRRNQEINIVQSVTNYLTGSTYDFGSILVGANSDITFTIQNIGQNALTLGATATVTTGNPPYSLLTNYSSTNVPAISGSTPGTRTFVIRFAPTGAGTFTGSVTVTSNDADEASYVINFTGVAVVPTPDINVQGLGNTIAPGNTPVLTDNTLFASQAIGSTSAANTFTIQNLGTAGLNLSGLSPYITLGGAHPGDFAIVAIPSNSVGVASSTTFSITFSPTYAGTRTATITIASNDPDEASYVFNISGTGTCVAPATISSVTPASGPVGTNVTITASAGDLTGTTVTFNSIAATVVSSTATQLVVTVPAGATSGNINITKTATSCVVSTAYTVINVTGVCAGLSELIMTEIYDQDGGSLGYIEVYNGTGAAIDLTPYFIRRYADNAALIANTYADYSFSPSITTIANGQVRYGRISTDANTASPNFDYSTPGFAGINGDDIFHLYHGTTLVDVYIVPNGTIGYTAKRNVNTAGPNTTSNPGDWTHTNTETLADLGLFVYAGPLSTIPTVTTDPVDVTTCNTTATFTVAATTGPGVGSLTYQWFYNSGTASGWTAVAANSLTGVVASNFNTASLTISGAIGAFSGYQFYCQVTQNTTCNAASDAAQLTVDSTVWNGAAWSNGTPTLSTGVVIAGNYDTLTDGSFEACSVAVNPTFTLNINPTDYVAIQNDLFVSTTANLTIEDDGSLVMIDDDGVVTNNGTTQVIRTTAPFELYDYTYWASPVNGADIATTFPDWRTDYSFEFNTANFSDTNTIDYNGTVTNAGVADSFDDFAPWAWLPYTGTMTAGKGYAIMGPTGLAFGPSASTSVTFSGEVNNGVISPSIVESGNGANTADDFNLVGNPYPSAIFANTFITTNGTKTSGSLYFWTHVDDVSISNPGPNLYNFITDDYAVYNLSGGTRASFTGSAVPTGYIASGQGFFVESQGINTLTFNNAMRDKGYNNTQFFRSAQPTATNNRVWLNLRNDDGLFGQLLVGYFEETTLDFDWAYDARVNQSNNYLSFYSMAANEKLKIQARPAFDETDIVPLGYISAVGGEFSISIDQSEGVLAEEATNIYLEDLEMHIIHDLKAAPYTFTTVVGKFENRFLLRYTDATLGNPDFDTLNNSVVVATNHGEMTIKSYVQTIDEVIVYDVLGRQLYQAKGIGANDFTATNISLSQQSLIVKIKLESGTIVTKKVLW